MKKYNIAIVIMRAQLYHNGHHILLSSAAFLADTVFILIGSSNSPPTPYNPFSYYERSEVILSDFKPKNTEVRTFSLDDYRTDYEWVQAVKDIVSDYKKETDEKICIVGHHKEDNSTYYLDMFPEFDYIESPRYVINKENDELSATLLREKFFSSSGLILKEISSNVPKSTIDFLNQWKNTESFKYVLEEYFYYQEYSKIYGKGPFVTVDAAIFCNDKILLIQRKDSPGKNLYALPGGFLDPSEKMIDGMIREAVEETCISIPPNILKDSFRHSVFYTDEKRSLRGRIITNCGLFIINSNNIPDINASSDAKEAEWIDYRDVINLFNGKMFEDHYFIVKDMAEEYFKMRNKNVI